MAVEDKDSNGMDFFNFCPTPLPHPQLDGYEICIIEFLF